MDDKILFVDDEALVLDGYKRVLHREFQVSTAEGGGLGLELIQRSGPFSVVISDMRMPGMSGAEFLAKVREKAPDTVRMLLTGHSDLDAAIDAVNEGNIFRYLTKPCEKDALVKAISMGVAQHRSVIAERELVKKAKIIGLSKSDWDAADLRLEEDFESPAGLPGPGQAKGFLRQILLGVDCQYYAVLIKLTMISTIEARYGEIAVADYLTATVQFLMQVLQSDDKIFHWSRDVLMIVARRKISPAAVRMEMSRLVSGNREHIVELNGRRSMIASPITFDLLPISQFQTIEDFLATLDAKLIGKI